MTDYTKLTDFASKDTLPTGNAAKIVKGTEIDDEFEAIETAIATKADLNSPVLVGTPQAVTVSGSDSSLKIATTAMVQSALGQSDIIDTAQLVDDSVTTDKLADDLDIPGNPTADTQATDNRSERLATTDFVRDAIDEYATLTAGAEMASASSDTIDVTYGPTGQAFIIGSAARKATFGNKGAVYFKLFRDTTLVRSEAGEIIEYDNRDSDSTYVLLYNQTGKTPGSTETWVIQSSGAGSATYATIGYIGF